MKIFLYLHGFKGSHQSQTSKILQKIIKDSHNNQIKFIAPQLTNASPQLLIQEVQQSISPYLNKDKDKNKDKDPDQLILCGCSLGGFFSLNLFNQYQNQNQNQNKNNPIKLILINPCLNPLDYIDQMMGEHINPHTDEQFEVNQQTKEALDQLNIAPNTIKYQNNILLLQQLDDQTINPMDAQKIIPDANIYTSTGGGHDFDNLASFTNQINDFI